MTSGRVGVPEVPASARERILAAAYALFSRSGVTGVGVDAVIAEAGVAKATLYRNFASKDELAIAFLERREARWTNGWLRREVQQRAEDPRARLLAIFDVFGEWFQREDFEGCAFVTVLLELDDRDSIVRQAAVRHLENIRSFVAELAGAAGIEDADGLARQWHILMKGSIVSAAEGDRQAAVRAQELGELLLARRGV
ncbi:MAG: regulatory protein TetR [Solirubrobacterales bacterium]|nr:regulatory protein TetR [Solirubrobacterales bacterium]